MIGRISKFRLGAALGLLPLMLAPSAIFAIFPPVTPPQPTVVVTGIPVQTPVKIQGDPGGGVPVTVPPVAKTPEPSTFVTAGIGLALGADSAAP